MSDQEKMSQEKVAAPEPNTLVDPDAGKTIEERAAEVRTHAVEFYRA